MYGVYILWSPLKHRSREVQEKYTPINGLLEFYVGFGRRYRYRDHLTETLEDTHNPPKVRIINAMKRDGMEPVVTVALLTADQTVAKRGEKFLIALIGRRDLRTGPLTNLTAGGDGGDPGPEVRAKMSKSHRRFANSERGREATRRRLQAAHTPEIHAKHSQTMREWAGTEEGRAQLQDMLRKAMEVGKPPEVRAKMSKTHRELAKTKEGSNRLERSLKAANGLEALEKRSRSIRRWTQTKEGREAMRKLSLAGNQPDARARAAAKLRKLTPEQADQIQQRLDNGEREIALGKEFGVCHKTISNVKHHKNGY